MLSSIMVPLLLGTNLMAGEDNKKGIEKIKERLKSIESIILDIDEKTDGAIKQRDNIREAIKRCK